MAVNRTTQVAMTTALGIFVILSFALGIMSYIFASRQFEAEAERDEARQQAADAQFQLTTAKTEQESLRTIIGVDADTPVADIETRLTELFDSFAQKEKSYSKLVELLWEEQRITAADKLTKLQQKDADLAREQQDKAAAIAAKETAESARQKAVETLAEEKQKFDAQWTEHEENQTALLDKQREAEDEARTLRSITQEIERSVEYIAPARRTGFDDKNPIEKLEVVRTELRLQAEAIVELNKLLNQLRVADPELQKMIAEYRSEDDRVDAIDGQIIDVDPRTSTVLISCSTTARIKPGLILYVFPPGEGRPVFNARKGTVKVSQVEGPSLLRATISQENARDPILSGDAVATSLWSAGVAPTIVIVGFGDLDRDGQSDRDRLVAMVKNAGGEVVDTVSPDTAFVVDLGPPPSQGDAQPPEWAADAKRQELAVKTARIMGVKIVGIGSLLDALGVERSSFQPNRLPRSQQTTRVPPVR